MRINLPVTQREVLIAEGETLLSTTDLKGRVVYANDAFVRVSGFTRDELYGKAHNVVRHPDMPEQAFADMWRTLRSGHTWSALVKNRRKDGDHYWVRANAAPVRARGSVVGYLSVRTRPHPDDVQAHEDAYRRLRAGNAEGLKVKGGFVLRPGLAGLWDHTRLFLPVGLRIQIALGLVGAAGVMALAAAAPVQVMLWPALGVAATCAALALWLQRGLVRPLQEVLDQARQVASGQPAASLYRQRSDEIGALMRSVEQAGLNVVSLIDDIREKGLGTQRAAEELRKGNADLSQGIDEAAASLEQSAAALEQLAATVRSNRDTAQAATTLASDAAAVAARGADRVGTVVRQMDGIATASRRVTEIVALIDGIAFQTNILALNAAVEAARAGEHGRGFAVVASEVRTLSQRSADAAREIRTLIDASQAQVHAGTEAVAAAGVAMDELTHTVQSLATMIREISTASAEQATGIEQVNAAIGQLDRMTQQNAVLVAQSSTATGALSLQAQHLAEAAAAFRPSAADGAKPAAAARTAAQLEPAT